MKSIFYILAILIPSISWCQNNSDTLEFFPLTIVGEISNIDVKHLQKADSLGKTDYFFTKNFKENDGLFLVKKEKGDWLVYDFGLNFGSNTLIKGFKSENNYFISIQIFRTPSGICESTYGIIILFDFINNEWTSFWNYNQIKCYNENGEVSSSECKVSFSIKGDFLEIKSSKKPDDKLYCFENGTYKYENRKFVKIE